MPMTRNDGLDNWANLALHHLGISSLTTFLVFVPSAGDLVEKGVMRRLPDGFDGNTCPYIFTWSEERPNKIWGMGSGCSPFFNTDREGKANTHMVRYYDEDRFEIFATRDIEKDEELTHTYVSLKWRTCFADINEIVHKDDP
jgi:hypothetical protein